jgi:hypothetical protein
MHIENDSDIIKNKINGQKAENSLKVVISPPQKNEI